MLYEVITALMGCPVPAHMDGRAVAAALDFIPPAPERGETGWDTPAHDAPSADDDAAMRKNLKDLGYM